MPGDDWIDTTGWNDDDALAPLSAPRHPLPAGQRLVAAVCCPGCASLNIAHYSTKADVSYWRCNACAEAWKLAATIGRDRAYLF